jgi:hypothetical protein
MTSQRPQPSTTSVADSHNVLLSHHRRRKQRLIEHLGVIFDVSYSGVVAKGLI